MTRQQLNEELERAERRAAGGDSKKEIRFMVGRKMAAQMFGVAAGTLANLLSKGRGPRAYKAGAKVLYKISDLEEYFSANVVETVDSLKN